MNSKTTTLFLLGFLLLAVLWSRGVIQSFFEKVAAAFRANPTPARLVWAQEIQAATHG